MISRSIWIVACLGILSLQGCLKDQCQEEVTYLRYNPVYLTAEEIRQDISVETPRALEEPGKLYFYGQYVLVGERNKGIHIIDNADPHQPVNLGFIAIPCNVDMAVYNDVLYADNCIDLLAIDISDPLNAQLIGRTENQFYPLWEEGNGQLAVYYETEEITELRDCESGGGVDIFGGLRQEDIAISTNESAFSNGSSNGGSGIGGSMARFTIAKDHLYIVTDWQLQVLQLENLSQPTLTSEIELWGGIETIFPHGDELYIGSNSGMFIFDNSTPSAPVQLSSLLHATACDPVFVKDQYAYVTLRDGTECQGFVNQLELIDISDLRNPILVETFKMDNPHGLSIGGNTLFLCEGDYGMKVFDISDPKKLNKNLIEKIDDLHAFDVIHVPGQNDLLMIIGEDGFYQYDSTNPDQLKLLSKIEIAN